MGLYVLLLFMVLASLLWCGIVSRLGYAGPLGLLTLIPFVGLVAILYWACSESPNEAKLRRLTERRRRSWTSDEEPFAFADR